MTTKLSLSALGRLGGAVSVPAYGRSGLRAGILHFGVGNFHRAHQAVYLDDLFNSGRDHDWAVVGAGVMPSDETMRQALAAQDHLTTVVEQAASGDRARVTGVMIDCLSPTDRQAIIDRLADPAIRIVSLTVTEGGYFIDAATARFDPTDPAIAADGRTPEAPRTVFGLITAGLRRRRAAGTVPFTVMSCDNIRHNGVAARAAVIGTARLSDPDLADWIDQTVAFPNGMVDRITPATGAQDRARVAREHGIDDGRPVFCETFRQWVLEDRFPAGRPALETVGVQFVPDVTPYETMKIRILNGGHATIAYPAGLLDIQHAHDAMAHPLILAFLRKVEQTEIIPVVPPVPDTDLTAYAGLVERRFANPAIGDSIRRLCFDGSSRQPSFIIPTIADRLKAGADMSGLALVSALWCRYCRGTTDSGAAIAANDPIWDRLQATARAAETDPAAWLAMRDIYGDVGASDRFRQAFGSALRAVQRDGVAPVLARYGQAQPVQAGP